MTVAEPSTPEEYFEGRPVALAVFRRVEETCRGLGALTIEVSRSQVAFRRKHPFAYLWLPGLYLRRPGATVVLTIAVGRQIDSPRFKEVVHPSPKHWIHHLEVNHPADIDEEVVGWLREAAERAT